MKIFWNLLILGLLMLLSKPIILVKELNNHDLLNFAMYRSRMLVSPFKEHEKIESPKLTNFLPIPIKLIGGPEIKINQVSRKPDPHKFNLEGW